MNATTCKRVDSLELAAHGHLSADMIDPDFLIGLHPLPCFCDDLVRTVNDCRCGTVILDQVVTLSLIIRFKLPDEANVGPAECIDVLVVIADYQQ